MFTEPTTSQSDIFADFMSQLPTELLYMVCGTSLLLLAIVIWIGWIKPRRQKQKERMQPGQFFTTADELDDLPDLDTLLSATDYIASRPDPSGNRVRLYTGEEVETDEVLAVLRDRRDGQLLVYMGGTAYRSLADAPAIKSEFVKTMRALNEVIAPSTPSETFSQEVSEASSGDSQEAPPQSLRDEIRQEDRLSDKANAESEPASPEKRDPLPGDLPSYKLEDSVTPQKGGLFKRPRYETNPVPELDIAAAIEAYLQHKLISTGAFPGRKIHVHAAEGGGVKIQVDDTYYESVDQVTDSQVKSFLAQTIQEWQDRQ